MHEHAIKLDDVGVLHGTSHFRKPPLSLSIHLYAVPLGSQFPKFACQISMTCLSCYHTHEECKTTVRREKRTHDHSFGVIFWDN